MRGILYICGLQEEFEGVMRIRKNAISKNTEGAIKKRKFQRNWRHRVTKTTKKKAQTQYVFDTTIRKQTQIFYVSSSTLEISILHN